MYSSEPIVLNDNTANTFGLEISGVKPKKTVTINDRTNDFRRTNSDSPELLTTGKIFNFEIYSIYLVFLDPFYSTKNNRANKNRSKKRSICKFHSLNINIYLSHYFS